MNKNQKRVLVVDDEEDLTWSISKNLAKDKKKYDLICVNSGKDAMNVLQQVPVDLVISDIRMPEVTGLDLLMNIKEEFPATKVIIMTAYGSDDIQKEVFRRGSIAYIEKPFEIENLRDLILNNLEEKKGFVGQVSDFQLTDIIQMNCLGRLTTALQVEKGSESGSIYFDEGNITHAEVSGMDGEEAFYEILSWQGGEFSSKKGSKTKKETIFKGWQSLLLEGMKRADEQVPERKKELDDQKEVRVEQLEGLLYRIGSKKGVLAVSLFDKQGFSLASHIEDEEKMQMELAELIGIGTRAVELYENFSQEYEFGRFKFSTFEFESFNSHLYEIEKTDYFIIVLSNKNLNSGALRLVMKKTIPQLIPLL